MDALLQETAERGWTENSREEFVRLYDQFIGRAIVYYLARHWHLEGREVGRLLSSVERRTRGRGETPEHPLLEALEETYLQMYTQIFQGKLVRAYVNGKRQGRIRSDFSAYLRGVIRHRVIDCLRKQARVKETQGGDEDLENRLPTGSLDWAKSLRAGWWDRLIRCKPSKLGERKELHRTALSMEEEAASRTKLCLACAELKAEGGEKEKEDLRMFLVYYLSNFGSLTPSSKRELPPLSDLSLERIRGLGLSWQEVFQVFGRECNPSRIRAKLRDRLEVLAA